MFSNLTDWVFTDFYDISKIMESPTYRNKHRPEQFRKYLDIINRKKFFSTGKCDAIETVR